MEDYGGQREPKGVRPVLSVDSISWKAIQNKELRLYCRANSSVLTLLSKDKQETGLPLSKEPARSPDIMPLDSFLWGFLDDEVCWRTYENVEQLRAEVQAAIVRITPRMLDNGIVYHCKVCLENEGGLLENKIILL
nr:unnamed protein product [Callosobruchus chinensis]